MTRDDRFDEAMSARLAKLSGMPMDMSQMEKAVRSQIDAAAPEPVAGKIGRARVWRRVAGIAASLILVALVAMALLQDRTVQASPDMMLQLHRDILAHKIPSMKVDSVDEVNQAFKAFGHMGVQLSGTSEMKPMECCMKEVGNKHVMCVLLEQDNVPVTLTVADLDAVKPLTTPTVMHNGQAFHVRVDGPYTMVTLDRGGHRVCIIGAMPAEKLMNLAEGLTF